MSIDLNPELEHRIALRIQSGRYSSPAEVIEEGILLLEARDGAPKAAPASAMRPVWETIAALGRQLSDDEWSVVPTDLARDPDRHLYKSANAAE
jgi:putative addiction module CopG family antidote